MEQLRSSRFIVMGVLVVFVLAAVTLGAGTLPTTAAQAQDAPPSAPAQDGAVVSIANFAFQPARSRSRRGPRSPGRMRTVRRTR